ncbi:serine hydrolase domain-containing protein [Paenibacillus apiarius]|uniref:serine hydrolase domain-containing protein n=1 Tax=Paenibacillus apiarius TaxID=46240 RepID=UPI00197F1202|nr:serine hydrolase domain-containing protein [Paenibacillus apiarius]MBN3526779.1 beta-lactamase family protein [Paenibacillus apiarius]
MKNKKHTTVSIQGTALYLKQYMNALSRNGHFNGAALVAHQGNILLCDGYGMANWEHEAPNSPHTKFRIGSITKGFTALAIMQLQELGLLSVHDAISGYLPGYPRGDEITLHHLLTHTSGIPDYAGLPDYWERTMRLYSPIEQTIASFQHEPLQFVPGERTSYTSSSFILLSAVIEKVSGLSFADYIAKRICLPLGMKDSGVENGRTLLKHFASGYSVCGEIIPAEYVDMSISLGGGGMYSTIADLYKWDRALYTEALISHESLRHIFGPYSPIFGGYGWVVTEEMIGGTKRKRAAHHGTMNGFCADFNRFVNDELVVIVLSNVNITPVERVSGDLARIVFGEELAVPATMTAIELAAGEMGLYPGIYERAEQDGPHDADIQWQEAFASLSRLGTSEIAVGVYVNRFQEFGIHPGRTIIITEEGQKLYLQMAKRHGAWYKYEIVPISANEHGTTFTAKHIDERIIFTRDNQGSITIEHRDAYGNRMSAAKMS